MVKRPSNNPWVMGVGVVLLIVFGIALVASLVNLWPAVERGTGSGGATATTAPSTVRLFFGLVTVKVTPSTALLLLVVIVGALGSLIHAATSFADFAGNRRFYSSWVFWYLVRPVVGSSLALLLYFAVRGGFFNSESQTSSINPYGMAAVAGLAGLFSKQATDKLREVFETLFHVSQAAGDAQRKDDLSTTATTAPRIPVLDKIEPSQVKAGETGVTIKLIGGNFVEGATAGKISGARQPTTYLGAGEIEIAVADALVAGVGTLQVTAITEQSGTGESRPKTLTVVA